MEYHIYNKGQLTLSYLGNIFFAFKLPSFVPGSHFVLVDVVPFHSSLIKTVQFGNLTFSSSAAISDFDIKTDGIDQTAAVITVDISINAHIKNQLA